MAGPRGPVALPGADAGGDLPIELVMHELLLSRVAAEEVERERERGRRGLMTGEQEDQRLVAHLLDVHRRAGVRITGAQQPREEILAARPRCSAPGDQVVG